MPIFLVIIFIPSVTVNHAFNLNILMHHILMFYVSSLHPDGRGGVNLQCQYVNIEMCHCIKHYILAKHFNLTRLFSVACKLNIANKVLLKRSFCPFLLSQFDEHLGMKDIKYRTENGC